MNTEEYNHFYIVNAQGGLKDFLWLSKLSLSSESKVRRIELYHLILTICIDPIRDQYTYRPLSGGTHYMFLYRVI